MSAQRACSPSRIRNRDDLLKRQLPSMRLSDRASNSLTRPLLLEVPQGDPVSRARRRFSVKGNAIITGGTGTLGLEAARALLEHGCSGVVLFDKNPVHGSTDLSLLMEEFPSLIVKAQEVDVTDALDVNAAFEEAAKTLGTVDMLLCFAGVVGCIHALEMKPQEWRRMLDINTTGSFLCAQAAAKQMIAQGTGGSIVFTASISGHRVNYPQPQVAYNVSKAALLHLKNSLAAEWARYGIRVNSISPGYMDTILNEGAGLEEARRVWAERNPMGRMGLPSELTGPVVLLCSAAGSYITGTDIVVDGGSVVF